MKHIVLFGPGTSPNLIVDDEEAKEIEKKFDSGEEFEVKQETTRFKFKQDQCWAIKIEDFKDHRVEKS